jgi:DNA-binding CsgD family transcriptional regulator
MRRKLTAEQIAKIPAFYRGGESTYSIARFLGVYPSTIKWHMRELGVIARSKSQANSIGYKMGRIKIPGKHILPNGSRPLNENKAYILGVLCGDGWLWQGPRSWQIGLQAKDKAFVERFAQCAKAVYGFEPFTEIVDRRRAGWSRQFRVRICSKAALQDINNYGVTFRTGTWRVPKAIMRADLPLKAEFVKGFFDSEGNVDSRRVQATSTNLPGLRDVQRLLTGFGIRSTIVSQTNSAPRRTVHNLRIQDRRSVEAYYRSIGFTIQRKQAALGNEVRSYRLYTTPHKDVITLVPEMRRLRAQGLSYERIAERMGLGVATVWHNIRE